MQPLRVASSFCWNCVSAFMTARACVGTAIIIDFGKQVRIVCLHGRGMYRNWKQDRSCPSLDCSARTFAGTDVTTAELKFVPTFPDFKDFSIFLNGIFSTLI